MAVMRIGRTRVRPPSMSASRVGMPCARSRSTRSSSTIALVTTMPMSIRKPMSARHADRPAGEVQRRERADRRERQAEQDDERRDERVEGQDHHHVDQQDGHAHRGEQAAEGLVLLLGDAGELDVDAGRDAAVGLERVDRRLDGLRHGARVVARDLGRDRRGGRPVDPGDRALDVDLLDGRDVPSGTLATVPTGSCAELLDAMSRPRGRPGRSRRSAGPSPSVTWVTVWATSALRTSLATWAAVSPTPSALFGSTVTWISGVALTRSL